MSVHKPLHPGRPSTYIKPGFLRTCMKCGSNLYSPGEAKEHQCGQPPRMNEAKEYQDKVNRDDAANNMTASKELTALRKKAKAAGVKNVNTMNADQLNTAMDAIEDAPEVSEIEAMRKEIKDKGGNLPRGKKSTDHEALQKVLDSLNEA